MRTLRSFYLNHLKRKMFNRIVLLYSMAAVVLFAFASGFMYPYQYQRVIPLTTARCVQLVVDKPTQGGDTAARSYGLEVMGLNAAD